MAILGVQLVFSMVMASVLSKLSPHFSLGSWILCSRLVRYLHPTESELRSLTGQNGVPSRRGKRNDRKKDDQLSVPKSLAIQLEPARVQPIDVLPMHFYTDYQWLVDFAVCSTLVYALTEVYYWAVQPEAEFNLSMLWCLLVIGFSLKVLLTLTAMYFHTDNGGEWVMCVLFGFFFLVAAMAVLVVDDDTLEFGLEAAYERFADAAHAFLRSQGVESGGPASLLACRVMLAGVACALGALLSFPGLRLARMHLGALRYSRDRPLIRLLLHVNIVAPLLISMLWVRPIVRRHLVREESDVSAGVMSHRTFEAARVLAIVAFCALRFSLVWIHLQAHLNMACEKVEQLRKQAGRINAIDLQKMVAHVFYYLCVVALQYIVPLILLLYCAFVLKTMGGLSWMDAVGISSSNSTVGTQTPRNSSSSDAKVSFALANLRLIFAPECFVGLFSFFCWWICSAWFTTCIFGLIYYSYFTA